MTTVVIVAALSATCTVLLAIIWNQHDRIRHLRIEAEESYSWANFFEDAERATRHELSTMRAERDALQRSHDNVHVLYCALVRRRLADNYQIIDRNLSGRSRMS